MAKVTIEFDTAIPEQYDKAQAVLGMLGGAAITFDAVPELPKDEHTATPELPQDNSATPPVPVAPAGVSPDTQTVGGLDSEGLPWDERIHTKRRTKRQSDMTWKLKRNLSEEFIVQTKLELKNQMAKVAVAVPSMPAVVPTTELTLTVNAGNGTVAAPPAPEAPATVTGPIHYTRVVQGISTGVSDGSITTDAVRAACQRVGASALPEIEFNPEALAAVAAELGVTDVT